MSWREFKTLLRGLSPGCASLRAMEQAGVTAAETAMMGDKLLTDMLGANLAGVLALMVEPAGGPKGAWNRVLHALQAPFKAVCRRRHT